MSLNTIDQPKGRAPALNYWRLWLFDAVLVSAGLLFFLAAQYGTFEFLGRACLMALLPFIPMLVLIGGGGSTIFVLTKIKIEKRMLPAGTARLLLAGPGLAVCLLLVLLAFGQSPERRLAYICHGHAPASASRIRVAGFSSFLNEEWLAVFQVGQKEFQTMAAQAELVPADSFQFQAALARSVFKSSPLLQRVPRQNAILCFQRVFKPGQEHQRGSVYAVFDPASGQAAVWRQYHD